MSNFLAVAAATATLKRTLDEMVAATAPGAVPNVSVTLTRPDASANGHGDRRGINVFLYQVTPNAAWRNADLPARGSAGTVAQRTQAAVDLHYLISFYGDESKLEPQRLLGMTVRTLHERPVLGRETIRHAIDQAILEDPTTYLQFADLPDQVEVVRFSPIPLNLEELSKLWSVFFQTPYALSVAYSASVVLLEGQEPGRDSLPVLQPNLLVVPFRHPTIDWVASDAGPTAPIVSGSTLVLRGNQLVGDITRVRIGANEIAPSSATDHEVRVPLASLPAGSLRPGVQGVQVIQVPKDGPAFARVESNVAAAVIRPRILSVTPDPPGAVTVRTDVTIGAGQRLVLLLNASGGALPRAYSLPGPAVDADTDTVVIEIPEVAAGTYLVRIQADGAESPLSVGGTGTFDDPQVTVP